MTAAATAIQDFSTSNPIYANAIVTAWTVDGSGNKTTTKAPLYASISGSTLLANPQTLDMYGKFQQPVYIKSAVILSVTGLKNTPSHDTGIISVADGGGGAITQPLVNITESPLTSSSNTIVVANGATLMTIPLPTSPSDGDSFQVSGVGAGGWLISQADGQQIFFGDASTTLGASGSLASSDPYDDVSLRYYTALGNWKVVASIGNLDGAT